jgi:aminoglycoside phosphotransferase (APT) family kinase protein
MSVLPLQQDLTAVAGWMDRQGLGHGPIQDLRPLTGGTQNIMLRFERAGRSYVLRRGPQHLRPRSNDVLRRECRVLEALADTPVPHARLIAPCNDESVLGEVFFYLMEPVDGFNAGVELPALHAGNAGVRHEMGLSMADSLADLGAVDHVAVGLGDFGRPDGFIERQVPRWLGELASYDAFDGYPGPAIGPVDQVAAWLDERRPTDWRPGIMHGDYHAANIMFSRTGPEVAAIVDWEMCTIGDPLLDLGWMLATWSMPGAPSEFAGRLAKAGDLATVEELVERYAARSDRDLAAIDWYVVLACFKLGIILEGTYARALAGKAPMEIGEQLHTTTLRLFERAQDLIA